MAYEVNINLTIKFLVLYILIQSFYLYSSEILTNSYASSFLIILLLLAVILDLCFV